MKISTLVSPPSGLIPQVQAQLVQEIVVTSSTDKVTFSGLDGLADKGYYIECEVMNSSVSSAHIGLYANGDLVDTNYKTSYLSASGAAPVGGELSYPSIGYALTLKPSLSRCLVSIIGGFFLVEAIESSQESNAGKNGTTQYCIRKSAALTNLLQLDIKSVEGGSIFGIGSRFRLMRRSQQQLSQPVIQASNIVEKKVLTADATSVTFAGLNSLVDGDYTLDLMIPDSATTHTSADVSVLINGDSNVANYFVQGTVSSNAGTPSSYEGNYSGVTYKVSTKFVTCTTRISVSGGKVYLLVAIGRGNSNSDNANIAVDNRVVVYSGTSNITSLVISGPTNSLSAGSRFTLTKSNPSQVTASGGLLNSSITTSTLASSGRRYLADSSASFPFPITLPQFPVAGDQIEVVDAKGTFGTTPVTLEMNGNNIDGIAQDLVLDISNLQVTLTYSGDAAKGWLVDIGGDKVIAPAPYVVTDISNATSGYLLKVGETVARNYAGATSVPLNIATQEGEYEVIITGNNTNPTNNTVSANLNPNNTTYGTSIEELVLYSDSQPTTSSALSTMGAMRTGSGSILRSHLRISTTTVAKITEVDSFSIHGVYKAARRMFYLWPDTTTPWVSLGTLTFPFAQTGKVIIRRIA